MKKLKPSLFTGEKGQQPSLRGFFSAKSSNQKDQATSSSSFSSQLKQSRKGTMASSSFSSQLKQSRKGTTAEDADLAKAIQASMEDRKDERAATIDVDVKSEGFLPRKRTKIAAEEGGENSPTSRAVVSHGRRVKPVPNHKSLLSLVLPAQCGYRQHRRMRRAAKRHATALLCPDDPPPVYYRWLKDWEATYATLPSCNHPFDDSSSE